MRALKQVCLPFVKSSFVSLDKPGDGRVTSRPQIYMTDTRLTQQIYVQMPAQERPDESATHQQISEQILGWLVETPEENATNALITVLREEADSRARNSSVAHAVVVGVIRRAQSGKPLPASPKLLEDFCLAYQKSHAHAGFRSLILRCLIAMNTPASLKEFAELLVTNDPLEPRFCLEIFSDLLKLDGRHAEALFPQLLTGMNNSQIAPFVLDYANFAYRRQLTESHPAKERVHELVAILSQLAERLGAIQDVKPDSDDEARQLGKQVTEAVSLGVSLCDALACIGDPVAIGCLNKTLGVEHRRLRVEAAAALAKLDVEDAKALLASMAADPVERLRVLNYAEELEILDRVDDDFSNIVARAEAEFVTYLSQPTQFGIAPQHVELIDQRELAWPGYEEPRNCYLFQFVYQLEAGEFTNIGIAGPLVKAIQPDLRHLSHDDIYAIFAGWHVDHPDIFSIDAERTVGQDQWHLSRMLESLQAADYEDVRPVLLAKLLDQNALIASAQREDCDGWAIVGEDSISWTPLGSPQSPLGAEDMFHLFVGRSLLRSFN